MYVYRAVPIHQHNRGLINYGTTLAPLCSPFPGVCSRTFLIVFSQKSRIDRRGDLIIFIDLIRVGINFIDFLSV